MHLSLAIAINYVWMCNCRAERCRPSYRISSHSGGVGSEFIGAREYRSNQTTMIPVPESFQPRVGREFLLSQRERIDVREKLIVRQRRMASPATCPEGINTLVEPPPSPNLSENSRPVCGTQKVVLGKSCKSQG